MHKLILKFFSSIKNIVYFLKILAMFFLMIHLLLWIQNLTHATWGWLQIFMPVLNIPIGIGEVISNDAINLFGAVFEYKYMIAVIIYVGIYYFWNFVLISLDSAEDTYDDVHRSVLKSQENTYNNILHTEQVLEEKRINSYKIIVHTSLKKKFSHPELGYNLEEQNELMNDFLIRKTNVSPVIRNGGFLYEYDNFDNVDEVLSSFFKLIKSNSPLDYVICIAVVENSERICLEEIDHLVGLQHVNKISAFANCAYRYKFNTRRRYGTSQLGLFQKGDKTMEVHEFIEIL